MVADEDDRTHYEVLGVDRRASKDKVREAYRDRLSDAQDDQIRALEAKRPSDDEIAAARREVSRVREAWQVLSDPVQRQRYDARLGNGSTGESDGELELVDATDDVEEDDDDTTPVTRGGARPPRDPNRPPGMFSPDHPPTPPSWPPGITAPPPRARTIALLIDCFVLLVFFIGAQIAAVQIVESMYPGKTATIDSLQTHIDKVSDCKDGSKKEKAGDKCQTARREAVAYLHKVDKSRKSQRINSEDSYGDVLDQLEEKHDDLQQDILPTQFGITGGIFLVLALLYLIPSTVVSGQTLGKRLLAVRLVNADGSKAGLRAALIHYGAPLLVAIILSQILGQLAFAIVLFGVLTWSRNPNRQGLQDRMAGTLVVDG